MSDTQPAAPHLPALSNNHHPHSPDFHHPGSSGGGGSGSAGGGNSVDALALQNLARQALLAARDRQDIDMGDTRELSLDEDPERVNDRRSRSVVSDDMGLEEFVD